MTQEKNRDETPASLMLPSLSPLDFSKDSPSNGANQTDPSSNQSSARKIETDSMTHHPVFPFLQPWEEACGDGSFLLQPRYTSSTLMDPSLSLATGSQIERRRYEMMGLDQAEMYPAKYLSTMMDAAYKSIDPHNYQYERGHNPRRFLTDPSQAVHNDGYDNEKHDLIMHVDDVLTHGLTQYVIVDLLGSGTFGQVVKCRMRTPDVTSSSGFRERLVAVKVIKALPNYTRQSQFEVSILDNLNKNYDPTDVHHIVRLLDNFVYHGHLCIVVELMGSNLYEFIKQNNFRGFPLSYCREIMVQCLDALDIFRKANIVHLDLKPENILLCSGNNGLVKLIDFGSACHTSMNHGYTYVQSRFYRAPEVILGMPYSTPVDMWSLGCIAVELWTGTPIFPGTSNYDQLFRIIRYLGRPSRHMLDLGKDTSQFFYKSMEPDSDPSADQLSSCDEMFGYHEQGSTGVTFLRDPAWHLKSREKYSKDSGRQEAPHKQYTQLKSIEEIVMKRVGGSESEEERRLFLTFVQGLLVLDPVTRWSPLQASQHAFITRLIPVPPPGLNMRSRSNTLASITRVAPPELVRIAEAVKEAGGPPHVFSPHSPNQRDNPANHPALRTSRRRSSQLNREQKKALQRRRASTIITNQNSTFLMETDSESADDEEEDETEIWRPSSRRRSQFGFEPRRPSKEDEGRRKYSTNNIL